MGAGAEGLTARSACDVGAPVNGGPVLAVLLLAYIFNIVDRQIVGILAIPIKTELSLSDTELSLMGGIAFAMFYSSIALPIAWLADRRSRVNIIAVCVAIWSLFTALCGLAQNFWHLFVARMGVGIGEAGGIAPSYALLSDYFPAEKRTQVMAIFSFAVPIGSALGIFFGGWIAANFDWRSAFLLVGLAGLPAALLVKMVIKEPMRGRLDGAERAAPQAPPPLSAVISTVAVKPSFWLLSLGAASASILGYGLQFWLPSLFRRSHGLELTEISWFYGSIMLVGGLLGIWFGGWLGGRAGRSSKSMYALVPALCFLGSAIVFALAIQTSSPVAGWLLFALGQGLSFAWLGPVINAVQHIVAPNMRVTAAACFFFIVNLIGIGFGIFMLGFLSDRMAAAHGDDSLKYAILYGLSFYLLSSILYFVASRHLERDWHGGAADATTHSRAMEGENA